MKKIKEYKSVMNDKVGIRINGNESYKNIEKNELDEIIKEIKKINFNRYPDDESLNLRKAYAEVVGIGEENVIAGNGLVGIVYDVSAHTAKVRTIINDTSMVSAMFLKTNDSCIVNGSLDTMEDGYLEVVYISKDAKVKNGDELVTSYVSSKFNEGITIGKVSDIKLDSTKLTKTAKVTPIVDFKHLKEVLVITDLKKTENLDTGTKE